MKQKSGRQTMTMTVEQAAKRLGISRALAFKAAKNGQLPVVRIGRRLLVSRSRLEKLLANGSR